MAGPRRSARLGSQTPSVPDPDTVHASTRAKRTTTAAVFDPSATIHNILRGERAAITALTKAQLQAIVHALADRDAESQERTSALEQDVRRAESERDANKKMRNSHSMKMGEIMRNYNARKASEEKIEAATQTGDDDLSPPAPRPAASSSQTAQSPRPVTPPDAIIPSPAAAPATSMWGSFTKFITSSFSKKRKADDEPATEEPTQKRQRPTEPASAPPQKRLRPTEPARPAPATEQRHTYRSASTYSEQSSDNESVAREQSVASTASSMPATRNSSKVPSRSNAGQQSSITPRPKRKRTTATLAAATPLPAIPESASPKTPKTVSAITPRPRTVATTRAVQTARKAPATHQPERRYAWEAKPPAAKEPNADARIAKIRRAEQLRRELAALEEEEALLRKVKRVKVDHLTEIPHNRPGDSSSTFRVPDIDSDDEMEVYDSVQERSNIFSASQQTEQAATPTPAAKAAAAAPQQAAPLFPSAPKASTPLAQPPKLPPQQAASPLPSAPATVEQPKPTQQPTHSHPQQTPQPQQSAPPVFNFPSVAPKPVAYHVTPGYQEACGQLFAQNFAAWEAQRQPSPAGV